MDQRVHRDNLLGDIPRGYYRLVGQGQEYGLMPVFKKNPPRESVRVMTPSRGSVMVRTSTV